MKTVAKPKRKNRTPRKARTLVESMRQFLTSFVWKQAHQARRVPKKSRVSRWDTHPLIYVMLVFTWCSGDSYAERFECARAFYAASYSRKRRPGETSQGLQKALAKLPRKVLRWFGQALRQRIAKLFGDKLFVDGWIPLGVDGSRLQCPRTAELEKYLDVSKANQIPMLWVTAIVHLRLGLLWSWWLGRGNKASERHHAQRLLPTLPKGAILVGDAGFTGFLLAKAILQQDTSFLIRMSGAVTLLIEQLPKPSAREGVVLYWPEKHRRAGHEPIRARLMRMTSKTGKDIWLLTNVLDENRLSYQTASRFYRWRWENESLFRTYKRTLKKVKLLSRTIRLVHREAETSLLATQLLLAQGALAMRPYTTSKGEVVESICSPRQVLLEIRTEIHDVIGSRRRRCFGKRLEDARRERRNRQSSKIKKDWPRPNGNEYKWPKSPRIREKNDAEKRILNQLKTTSAA